MLNNPIGEPKQGVGPKKMPKTLSTFTLRFKNQGKLTKQIELKPLHRQNINTNKQEQDSLEYTE